ncbi:cytochrome c1 [Roseospira marina]|uniref:Cytochrome c1 n=1 Tax=Roseospira marina TaxID=140057 RepID=A0A5M6I9S7_9PROT|nr:cytochrome c1 [Roseospira marina]KAA5605034.1 cytochrome c1 [Roseospira marina]MBB4314955.1 cytochrome c1 [Roseospira marina]MBB5087955.1 cytochrome c1 [Roseospira marina]
MSTLTRLATAAMMAAGLSLGAGATGALASSGDGPHLKQPNWSFNGLFGGYDEAQLRRGWEVYSGVCKSCHPLDYMHYRNLEQIGYTADEVKEIAASFDVPDGPDEWGEMYTRPATPMDPIAHPYENDAIAKLANGGVVPPNLSVMARARDGGADYIYSLLLGYADEVPEYVLEADPNFSLPPGKSFNHYFPGHAISMPQQLFEGILEYSDGSTPSAEQMALDVTSFLQWAAEPELEDRKALGRYTLLFLIVLTGLLYAYKREIWKDAH